MVGHQAELIEREPPALRAGAAVRPLPNAHYGSSALLSLWTLRHLLAAREPVRYTEDWRMPPEPWDQRLARAREQRR